jgi:thiamine kinase-like enzyme
LIFKIQVSGNPYLLRVIMRTDELGDPTHYYQCMLPAAEAGLAPRVHYASIEDRISITDYIDLHPFQIPHARIKMADLVRQLHALPKFPSRMNYLERMDGFVEKFRSSQIIPENFTRDLFRFYSQIKKVYPTNDVENLVSCHNDLKPENFIFDGQRPWIVDWEAAFLNDRYLDLTVLGNFLVRDDAEEAEFLEHYFGRKAEEYEHARHFLMSQLLHVFYFSFFLQIASSGEPIQIGEISRHPFRSFHDRIWEGAISLAEKQSKLEYALVHMDQFLLNSKTNRFEDSLRIISNHNRLH